MKPLTDSQKERYARHLAIAEIGEEGQQKLLASKVLVIGAGGLGSPVAMYLAAAGVGTIGIADADEVDLSNLQRQIIHSTADAGRPKVDSAKARLNGLNPDVQVITHQIFVTKENILPLIADYDFVIDCTDNFTAKFLINDACVLANKPFSHAGVVHMQGQMLTYLPGEPCYRCLFEEAPPDGAVPTSKEVGILGATPGVIGALQATEAIKYLTGIGKPLTGAMLTYDALAMEFRRVRVPKNPHCAVCGEHPRITLQQFQK